MYIFSAKLASAAVRGLPGLIATLLILASAIVYGQDGTAEPEQPGDDQDGRGGFLTDPAVVDKPQKSEAADRMFPLWKSVAGDATLPPPWSVAFVAYTQAQKYDIEKAIIEIPPLPPLDLDVMEKADANIFSQTVGIKGALWLFPFLNVHVNVGYSDTDADIFLRDIPVAIIPPSGPAGDPEVILGEKLLKLRFDGPYYAAGATLVGGWNNWWSSLTATYAVADLEASVGAIGTNEITTERVLIKIGYTFSGANVWFGAGWMDEKMETKGELDDFAYDVVVSRADWTPVVGVRTILHDHWDISVEGGLGDRVSGMLHVGYNF